MQRRSVFPPAPRPAVPHSPAAEVKALVERAYRRGKDLILTNVAALHKIAEALLEKETLDGDGQGRLDRGAQLLLPQTHLEAFSVLRGRKPKSTGKLSRFSNCFSFQCFLLKFFLAIW